MAQSLLHQTVVELCIEWNRMTGTGAVLESMEKRLKHEQEYDEWLAQHNSAVNTKVHELMFRVIAKGYLARHFCSIERAEMLNDNDFIGYARSLEILAGR